MMSMIFSSHIPPGCMGWDQCEWEDTEIIVRHTPTFEGRAHLKLEYEYTSFRWRQVAEIEIGGVRSIPMTQWSNARCWL